MADEAQQGGAALEVLKYVLTGAGLLLSNVITYWLSKKKNKSDLAKTDADTTKTRVETVNLLLKEVDEMIVTTQRLRAEVDSRVLDRLEVLKLVNRTSAEVNELIELCLKTGAVQELRMKVVLIAERLYKIRDLLEIKIDPGVSQTKSH